MSRRVTVLSVVFLLAVGGILSAEEPDVQLRIEPVTGEPGEEVAVEFWATVKSPLRSFFIFFDEPASVADFTRTEVAGTASAHVHSRGLAYNPRFFQGGFVTGVYYKTTINSEPLAPGENLLLVKAMFQIHPDAAAGDYPIVIARETFTKEEIAHGMIVVIEGDGLLRITEPGGPRPVNNLSCSQDGEEAVLEWGNTELYDEIRIEKNGELLEILNGSVITYRDRPAPGQKSYKLVAVKNGTESLPSHCSFLMEIPRPDPVLNVACNPSNESVLLTWTNSQSYDALLVFRNSTLITELQGSSQSYEDPFSTDLFTVYTVTGRAEGVESLPATCKINEFSDLYIFRAEVAHARAEHSRVPVRIFGTNPTDMQGMNISLRIPPDLARITEVLIDGTTAETANYDLFLYQAHVLDTGETSIGILYDVFPSPDREIFPAGGDQHVVTVMVDILPEASSGTRIPVELGAFGEHNSKTAFSHLGLSIPTETRSGAILVGSSPVPLVKNASAAAAKADGLSTNDIDIRWSNSSNYHSINIERDGIQLETIGGSENTYLDLSPGPGVHRYHIVSMEGDSESFPVVVSTRPRGVPGTFIRGDVNSDGQLNLSDGIALINYLFLTHIQPDCLDAADADDSGKLNLLDVTEILNRLFFGADSLPPPGPETPWFDSTDDELSCG